ncbi:MAG TPA: hypothetical protein VKP66_11200 [Steroidobacteraceae bacterium]|nr:hypothetical protein [Steroidobacteraceae bacterium]
MTPVLHPNQFQVNQAWIVFQLNETPIDTEQDGSFNCLCLMDAASCFLLGSELIPSAQEEPSQTQARHMLTAAWAKKGEFPKTLYMPTGRFPSTVKAAAEHLGMAVVTVPEDQLLVFIGEARDGYREHMQHRRNP